MSSKVSFSLKKTSEDILLAKLVCKNQCFRDGKNAYYKNQQIGH